MIVFANMKLSLTESNIPLGICYIAAYLREKGFDVGIVEKHKNLAKEILKLNPEIVGISSTSSMYWKAVETAEQIKKLSPDTKIIIGGSHITAIPNSFPNCFDIGVIGEGELTMHEIALGKPLEKIKGIIFRKNGKLVMTEPRPLIQNLDMLPFPARDLVDMNFYLAPRVRARRTIKGLEIISGRGCPYNCIFCGSEHMWHRNVRYFSADYVRREIRHLIDTYGVEEMIMVDDIFSINMDRLKEFAKILPKEVEYTIQMRANLMNEERCRLFKEIGVREICVGFESNSPRILNYLKGNTVTVEDNKRTLELCEKYGFELFAYAIIGSPTETKEEMLQTLDLLKHKAVTRVGVNILTPLPGTQLWEETKARGIVSDDMDFRIFDFSNANRGRGKRIHIASLSPEELTDMYNFFAKETDSKNYSPKISYRKLFSLELWKKLLLNPKNSFKFIKYFKLSNLEK